MILVSIFRDSTSYIDRFVGQVKALREHMPVTVVAVEGDSIDDTYDRLTATDFNVYKVEHGGPYYESRDILNRWRQIAIVCNVAMTIATRINVDGEPVVYIESDLIWEPETLAKLVSRTEVFPAVAPMSMQNSHFYDTWGHTKDGRKFSPYPPYHPGISPTDMTAIDTAGSCIAMSADAAAVVEFSQQDCIRGVGRSLYANGFSLWLDPTLKVIHP